MKESTNTELSSSVHTSNDDVFVFLCETSGVAATKIQLCIEFQTYSRILV